VKNLVPPTETIVAGTSKARREFARLFEIASKGTPVTIVAGERQVTMVDRVAWLDLLRLAAAAEETAALLADREALRKLKRSEVDVRARRGVTVAEARRRLGIER
jgi:hypothetical protein